MTRRTRSVWPAAAMLLTGAVLAAPALVGQASAESGREAISSILKELGVDPSTLEGGAGTPAAGSAFTEAQRREIEEIVDGALASRGFLPSEGVGTVREPDQAGAAGLLDAGDPRGLLAVLSRYGEAEEGVTSQSDPFIVGMMDGIRYRLDFNDCGSDAACRDVMFSASFDSYRPSLEFLNAWNIDHRYGVATRDEDGSALFRMPVNLHGGVTETNWSDTIDWWRIAAFEFREGLSKNR